MKTLINKSIVSALSFLFVIAFSPLATAAENPFGMSNTVDIQVADSHMEGKCGEGKCGGSKKDRKCDDDKKGKCGEGKCGAEMKEKSRDNKCGDGKKSKPAEPKCGGSE